jgi:hypothetical protein
VTIRRLQKNELGIYTTESCQSNQGLKKDSGLLPEKRFELTVAERGVAKITIVSCAWKGFIGVAKDHLIH